jgi:hypothetical protein
MSFKKITRAWKKGNEIFYSIYGVKDDYARELLSFGEIKYDGISRSSFWYYTPERCSKILEEMGYRWIKVNPREEY